VRVREKQQRRRREKGMSMTREELAPILFDAYQRTPDQFLAMADAALEAMKPATTPNDDERRKLWRKVFIDAIASLPGRGHSPEWTVDMAKTLADAALAADAEKWGKP